MAKRSGTKQNTRDIRGTLIDLSEADLLRLRKFAQLRARALVGVDWQDLLHEAIIRTLDGARVWPDRIPFMIFMKQTIRSIANEYWRRSKRSPIQQDSGEESVIEHANPERTVVAERMLVEIESLFGEDYEVMAILEGLGRGDDPDDIRECTGMTPTQYASARRRIRRGLARAFPDDSVP